jgi:hypothetical protein
MKIFSRKPLNLLAFAASLNSLSGPNMRHTALAAMLVSILVPMAAHAAPATAPCDLLDQQMLTALNLGDANTKVEHKPIPATAQAPANRMDVCTFTPRIGSVSTLSVMSIPLGKEMPQGKPVCTERSENKVGIAYCHVMAKDSIVTVSLVSRRAGFETLSTVLRSHFERLFAPASARR